MLSDSLTARTFSLHRFLRAILERKIQSQGRAHAAPTEARISKSEMTNPRRRRILRSTVNDAVVFVCSCGFDTML